MAVESLLPNMNVVQKYKELHAHSQIPPHVHVLAQVRHALESFKFCTTRRESVSLCSWCCTWLHVLLCLLLVVSVGYKLLHQKSAGSMRVHSV